VTFDNHTPSDAQILVSSQQQKDRTNKTLENLTLQYWPFRLNGNESTYKK
jgi:hypothetical protein